MTDIYKQFDKTFSKVSAYTVHDGAEFVGRVCFKHGESRTTCYAQVWGAPMVRGHANGFGYDKISAAAEAAVSKLLTDRNSNPDVTAHISRCKAALSGSDGERWNRRLEATGYRVAHAID